MAFWNAPIVSGDHPRRACLAALEMLRALDEMNKREGVEIRIGVGINTGACCVGNLGSEQRFSYSAIGDPVNVAARVEGLTKQYGLPIMVTENTAVHTSGLALLEVDLVRVVGRSQPIAVFALLGDGAYAQERAFQSLFAAHSLMLSTYRAGAFAEAAEAVTGARNAAPPPMHFFYDLYAKRIATLREGPPPENWDGVFAVLEK